MQEQALRAAVSAVAEVAESHRVTGYRWFDLRDADSASPSFESRYGLMRDDYTPEAGLRAPTGTSSRRSADPVRERAAGAR